MTSMKIRKLEPERDADAIVAIVRATNPFALTSREEWLHRQAAYPERAQMRDLVAEIGGRVVGWAETGRNFFGGGETASLGVLVEPESRSRGVGSALYERILEHALAYEVPTLKSMVTESAEGVAFAQARGFVERRAERWSALDPRTVAELPDPSIVVEPAGALDPHDLHRVDEAATRDMPATEPVQAIPYEEWLEFVWRHPFFTKDGSFGALVDGELACVVLLLAERASGRAMVMFTGTLREYRGRGLARAAKLASAHWAAANGIIQIATANDETNAPMLAVNERLGFRAAGRRVEFSAERERLLRERGEDL
jgi:GNAT superfamily N-acetyltransferase